MKTAGIYKRHADTNDKPVSVCTERQTTFLSFEYLDNRKEFYIEIGKSACIEFSIGGFYPYSNKELHRSRFYFVTKYYEGNERVKKDEEIFTRADDFLKKFKK